MLTSLRIQNFKSWADTGELRLAPLTGLFGSNSSGKSSILQFLLMLKQTAESTDRAQVLNFGNDLTQVELGTFGDILYAHDRNRRLEFDISWRSLQLLPFYDGSGYTGGRVVNSLGFTAKLKAASNAVGLQPIVESFEYRIIETDSTSRVRAGVATSEGSSTPDYELRTCGFPPRSAGLPAQVMRKPTKYYGFPENIPTIYPDTGYLWNFAWALEEELGRIFYLGPLRDNPKRHYAWSGGRPSDVGHGGESVVDALLGSRDDLPGIQVESRRKPVMLEERVALWLKELGLVAKFRVAPIVEGSNLYQVLVRRTNLSAEVPLTDVGFGVSQVLPVITLLYYVPEGSTVILEQPEIHLHPSVQSGLADVILDAIKIRKIQVIVESHSEHFLRRIQRRIAEDQYPVSDAVLYFCALGKDGASTAEVLDVDDVGNIRNWPKDFFGNDFREIAEMTIAQQRRKIAMAANQ